MSTLLVDELFTGVTFEQNVQIEENVSIAFIRPWIYKHGVLTTGDLRCEVYDGATLLKTVTINYVDINAAVTETYAHGYIRFDMSPLALNLGTSESTHVYTFKFSMINYTDDSNSFIGICRDWDNPKYPIYNGPAANDSVKPCGLEIYAYRR